MDSSREHSQDSASEVVGCLIVFVWSQLQLPLSSVEASSYGIERRGKCLSERPCQMMLSGARHRKSRAKGASALRLGEVIEDGYFVFS